MESKIPLLSEQLYNEIISKYASSGTTVPEFIAPYEEKEPVLTKRVKKACADISYSYKQDFIKSGINKSTAEQLSSSLRADLYVMTFYGYLLSDKSKDICWENSMKQMWGNSPDEESK